MNDLLGPQRECCWYCGEEIEAATPSDLNLKLVRHARNKHTYEIGLEEDRDGTFDPIAIADLVRSGPDGDDKTKD